MDEEKTTMNQETPVSKSNKNDIKPMGPTVGTILIIIILIIGGLYIWGAKLSTETPTVDDSVTGEDIAAQQDETIEALVNQSSSDEVSAIEEDLNATDLENLDAELGNIEAELGL